MEYKLASFNTKKSLAASLKKLACEKPFSKITVSDLIRDCGVNRKTFYYHFEDIYALLQWMLEQEAIDVVRDSNLSNDYADSFFFAIDYIKKNRRFLQNLYHSLGRGELKSFFYDDFIGIVGKIVDDAEKSAKINVSDEYKKFVTEFYTEAFAGSVLGMIDNDLLLENPEKEVLFLKSIIRFSIPAALKNSPF